MNNQIESIKAEIRKSIDKGQLLSWNQVYNKAMLSEANQFSIENIRNWYELIFNQSFINEIPEDVEELIFHCSDNAFTKKRSSSSVFLHDIEDCDFFTMLKVLSLSESIEWNTKTPFCSFFIKKNDINIRATLIHPSLTSNKEPKAFFRILNNTVIDIKKYNSSKDLSNFIKEKKNILIAGATGSGKTTLTNSLLALIPKCEHTMILEDTFELISPHQNTSRLISTKEPNGDLNSLLTYSLRMSPDRIILGELRSIEVITFIQAMNTGHRGLISTIHANNARDAINRVALLYTLYAGSNLSFEMVLKLVCENIDQVIFIENKKVREVINVYGSEKSNIFFDII